MYPSPRWTQGYAVGVAAKTTEDTSSGVKAKYKLEGTIESVVREIEVSKTRFERVMNLTYDLG